jgi:putative ABC transport system permease protein
VRTSVLDPSSMAPQLRREVARLRPDFLVSNAITQRALVDQWSIRERLLAALSMFFASLALLLAGIGLYGVLNYSVLQRRREIGIRMALGASVPQVAWQVTAQLSGVLIVGSLIGLAAGLLSQRLLVSLLYSVKATEFAMITLPLAWLALAAILASLPPVIRAVRIDPSEALRTE